jgi:hypothetical protein
VVEISDQELWSLDSGLQRAKELQCKTVLCTFICTLLLEMAS